MKNLINVLGILFTSLIILSCTGRNVEKNVIPEEPWYQYTDTIGTLFIIKFEYPRSYVAEQIQNGICVGKLIEKPINDITNTSDWCIWIEDGDVYSMGSIINTEKRLFESSSNVKTDTINFLGKKAIRLSYDSNPANNNVYRREIILQEHSPIILVVKKESNIEGFERFVESIQVLEYSKNPN